VSKDTSIQQIKVAGEYYVLMPIEDYHALAKAAQILSSSFKAPNEVHEIIGTSPIIKAGHSRLKAWRRHRGYTLDELAKKAGYGKSYLSEIETGKRQGTIKLWNKISIALAAPLEELLPEDSNDDNGQT
jgi:DNA-binding XRE family transcriptional regulator